MAMASAPVLERVTSFRQLGLAWIALWLALAIHVLDEALTGFLSVYNPTVTALRERLGFWPMPTFTFTEWITGLSIGILILALLTPFAFSNARWIRPIFYICALLFGIANACGHTLGTILGRTVESVQFSRPAPGFYSSPLLLAVGIYSLVQLHHTRKEVSS